MMELTNDQKNAFERMMNGEDVLITGGAGTGKTKLMEYFMERADLWAQHTVLIAPTGKASLKLKFNTPCGVVHGSTFHRTFGFRSEGIIPLFSGSVIPNVISKADRIIIDEVSMMRIDWFDYLAAAVLKEKANRDIAINVFRDESVNPLQIILVGDFHQLSPVVPKDIRGILNERYEKNIGRAYAFQSDNWAKLNIKTIELKEIVRQSGDPEFAEALNLLRKGNKQGIIFFNQNCSIGEPDTDKISLCGINDTVDAINNQYIPSKGCWKYSRECTFNSTGNSISETEIPCEKELILFPGARVVCTANNKSAMNGEVGKVIDLSWDSVTVEWKNGKINEVEEYEWDITAQEVEYETKIIEEEIDGYVFQKEKEIPIITQKKIATYKQIPLRLAYATTVHKSQGETIDEGVNVILNSNNGRNEFFNPGQLYTALSRVRNSSQIKLSRPLTSCDVKNDQTINNFFNEE